jgi:hypothetical protein
MITHQNITEWRGEELVDREGGKLGNAARDRERSAPRPAMT